MSRYIDADKINAKLMDEYHGMISDESMKIYKIMQMLDNAPAVDVVKVKHGKWIRDDDQDGWRCSECGHATNERILKWYQEINGDTCNICYQSAKPFYCSRCGAKMDLED